MKKSLASIQNQFPILTRKVGGKPLTYLDNGATTQKPERVIRVMDAYYRLHNANVHRGIHTLSEEATLSYEVAHEKVAKFIGAKSFREIIFTRGTTDSFNMLAYTLEPRLKKGDEIIVTEAEHHSNFVPWQQLAKRTGVKLIVIPYDKKKKMIVPETIISRITKKTKLVSLFHVSNVLGQILPIRKIAHAAHQKGALVAVDAAQSVAHMPVNVSSLDCDFLAFSGHKMYGPTGIGVLYGKESLLRAYEPPFFGGDMVREVSVSHSSWNDLPWKFEAGTPSIAEGIGLGEAVDFIQEIGFPTIMAHEKKLVRLTWDALSKIKGLTLYGLPPSTHSAVLSFTLPRVHPHDLASLLSEQGIAIRAGHHCAMPLHTALNIPASSRASFSIYNTEKDVRLLAKHIKIAQGIFS